MALSVSEGAQGPTRPPYVRILALNGGGARCWSALLILEKVMEAVARRDRIQKPKPCEYFHLIVGSEWGAILAILLGRLRLSIEQCHEWLGTLAYPYSSRVFRIVPGITSRRSKYYQRRFQKLVKDQSPDSNGNLSLYDQAPQDKHALTMALATNPTIMARPKRFRSYSKVFEDPDTETPVWKVALAAIATPLDLDPVIFPATSSHSKFTCIASSLAGFSNPSWIGLIEAREYFDPNSIHTVLNIGCGGKVDSWWPSALGHVLPVVRGFALTRMVIGQVNDANGTAVQVEAHRQMLRESADSGLYYQYFSAPTVTTSYYDWSERSRERIERGTNHYLNTPNVGSQIDAIANRLVRLQDIAPIQAPLDTPSDHFPRVPTGNIEPPLAEPEGNPFGDGNQLSERSNSRDKRTKSSEDALRIPLLGKSSSSGELQGIRPSAQLWLANLRKSIDLIQRLEVPFPIPKVKLAILDTGIDARHPWINENWIKGEKKRYFYDFTSFPDPLEAIPVDESGHGTQMAGLVLQCAPDVDLYVLRVFTNRTFGGSSDPSAMERVSKAMFFAIDELEVNIMTMAFAFEGESENALDGAITQAINKNVILIAAASNSGHQRENPYPASDRRVFRANAVDEYGNRLRFNPPAGNDNNNDNLAVLGADLLSTWPSQLPGGHIDPDRKGYWKEATGSSCSTALLSGICALAMAFGRTLRVQSQFPNEDGGAENDWDYVDRPQGTRFLFWQMANGRSNRTEHGFSDVRPWRLLNEGRDINEIGKLYLDALRLGREGMS